MLFAMAIEFQLVLDLKMNDVIRLKKFKPTCYQRSKANYLYAMKNNEKVGKYDRACPIVCNSKIPSYSKHRQ